MNRYEIFNTDAFCWIENALEKEIKVNHIITDPPYNISKKNNFSTMKNPRQGVDFGLWDNNFALLEWIEKFSKILDQNGSFIVFCSYKFISDICKVCKSSNLEIKDILVWQKNNPMPRNTNRRYVQDMEFALWAVKKGAKWTFNKTDNLPYLRSLYKFPVVAGKERTSHPTQKSLALMSEIIKIHTNSNDIILDPFMGSGSTGVAAVMANRYFIGIEKDKNYFEIAKNRLEKASIQISLDL
ncbi:MULTISPECIES: DNA-methyltransferase [Campylobacter]|uniref:DNA-methyltransferase n=1 Tax=Campylobacter TaxID=194 RepID=UPI000A349AEB|nr:MULTISPECIES: site-specific DNA-methyltransferase [Campylobacter]MCI7364804.1 site-specific DNA-methyltransferase [Campylobacter lanienae]MEE3776735.1 site-specific DNA-methyltransferase [Campylobacter sp. CX2-4080-23]